MKIGSFDSQSVRFLAGVRRYRLLQLPGRTFDIPHDNPRPSLGQRGESNQDILLPANIGKPSLVVLEVPARFSCQPPVGSHLLVIELRGLFQILFGISDQQQFGRRIELNPARVGRDR